ncbi:urate hydroxylase PuuD [Woeseia oceani]|uniref:Urate oxidase N-terminal domain-containing protein n=1 Tax=Woeseia oceani TaxID=1548547 RepID=A0A193LJ12_9GAMM|nr:urate hydroxylase PuuD [Woeseia oceani]ANO52384.1 hypothetical protein BA177_15370 [Woeseia oceani]
MEAYVVDWLNLLGRWVHLITGVAWIGSSFYFIWLDNHLVPPAASDDDAKGVGGELWSVHGGGFYHAQKYRVAPAQIPPTLHWFKWEAYSTWFSGMFLLALIYWYGASIYLIDPTVADLSPLAAVGIGVAVLLFGWKIYDGLCRSPLGNNERALSAVLFALVALLAWGLCQLFSGRGAYIHYGAVLGSIMVANVYYVIIPGQRRMVAAAEQGKLPDPEDGLRAKQRSVHNTYFTLPVLFVMTSNHFAMTFSHKYNWLILIALSLAGALIRVWFVARHKGRATPLPLVVAGALLLAVAVAIAPRSSEAVARDVTLAELRPVIEERCTVCHAARPTHPAFPAAPAGVLLETDEQIIAERERIYQQTVVTRVMPIGNLTGMSDDERSQVDAWYRSAADHDD